jgi:hypothetical protein
MDQLVVEEESMTQTPVASSQKKNACGTCGSEFAKQSNLKRHIETKHTDQNTPEAVAQCRKLKEYRKNTRRERRANDPIYKEKQRQISKTNRMNKKSYQVAEDSEHTGGVSNDVKAKEVSIQVETKAEQKGDGMWTPTDVVHTLQPPPATPTIVGGLDDEDSVSGAGERVKNAKSVKPTNVLLRVETTALTTANVTSFFTPKYDNPRSKEQRAANPRPSAI